MLEVGLPAGLQGIIFSISNVLIQSSINSFGSLVMAGNTAASNIEGFVYTSMNAVYQTSLSFTSQNFGARKYDRIDKILLECLAIVTVVGLVLGQGAYFFGQQLLSIYSSDEKCYSKFGIDRLAIISTMYCLCGIMDTLVGSLRGVGYSILPMLVSLTGVCVIRVIWIFTVFKSVHTTFSLYISYPITWVITLVAHGICFMVCVNEFEEWHDEKGIDLGDSNTWGYDPRGYFQRYDLTYKDYLNDLVAGWMFF